MNDKQMMDDGERRAWDNAPDEKGEIALRFSPSALRNPASLLSPFSSLLLLLVALLLAACDSTDPGSFEEEYVLEAYLIAGEPLQTVRLSRTTPVNRTYNFSALAVRGATVRLHRLGAGGGVAQEYTYHEDPQRPGVYRPDDGAARATPLGTYALAVTTPDGARIAATTVVPDTFRVVRANADTVVYQSSEQLQITVTRSASPGRDQGYYLFVTEAFDAREEQLTPFAKALYEDSDGDVTLEELRVGGSPILNEANYDANPDGTLTLDYPWLGVTFYGPNRVSANAVDDNLYDYIRSQSVQQGGSTFSPGEIPNPIEHVEGARGVFGSYARASFDVFVARP